jgi:hypothetical protein
MLAWFIGAFNLWTYLTGGLGLPWLLALASFLIPAVFFGLSVLLVRNFLLHDSIFFAAPAFPFWSVTAEYLGAAASPHSPFGNLAYTQTHCQPLTRSGLGFWAGRLAPCEWQFYAA